MTALRALVEEGRRLITVTGPAGVGKSRIAIEALAGLAAVATVPAESADVDTVIADIALRVGGADVGPGRDGLELLAAMIGARPALVLVDDLEDLGPDAARLGGLLDLCPTVRLVITSRSRLRLRGETTLRIDPLAVPADDRLVAVEASPAATLFEARAREADPAFRVTAGTAVAVARICRATDGLPLALELAAGWLRALDVATVADRVSSSLELFVSDEVDRPARQRSLGATLAWSLAACSPDQLEVLEVLAAFPAGLPLGLVGELLDAPTPLDTIGQLVERSLARVSSGSDPRVTLPAPVRHASAQRAAELPGRGHAPSVRLLAWTLRVATEQAARLRDDDPGGAVARLDDEIGNLRAGFDLAVSGDEPDVALELVDLLVPFLRLTGRGHEALEWIERAEPLAVGPERRVRLGTHRAMAMRDAGDPIRARDIARDTLDIALASGNEHALAEAGATFAGATMWFGWDAELTELFASLRPALARAPVDVRARFTHAATNAALVAGDLDRADALGREARRLYGETTPVLDRIRLEVDLGRLAASRGEAATADACFEAATQLSARSGHQSVELVRGLASAAQVALERRETARAIRLSAEARNAAEALRSPFDQAQTQLVHAMALADGGDTTPAREVLASSLRRLRDLRARIVLADGVLSLALLSEPVAPPPGRALQLMEAALTFEPGLLERSAPHWRERAEALRRRAADVLGPDEVDRVLADARTMSLDDAVTDALAWLEPPPGTSEPTVQAPFGQLSAREREVLTLVARGLTDRQIADRLVLGVRTVNTHVSTMLRKLGVGRRSDAAAWAIDHGL